MNLNNCNIHVTQVDPRTLNDEDFMRLNEVTQDMWADGIGEFVQCTDCWHMHSKKDIFWHLPTERYSMTVRQIMWDFEIDTLSCVACSWPVRFVFWKPNMNVIKERLLKTKKSFLVVAFNEKNGVVGYEDWYQSDIDGIFNREYHDHYQRIWVQEIRKRAMNALGCQWNSDFLALSDIGLLDRYRNLVNLSKILHAFAHSIPNYLDALPWITEIDEQNSLSKISGAIGWISLWIRQDPNLWSKIVNTGKWYKSDLVVYHEIGAKYKKYFTWNHRWLVQLVRWKTEKAI